jgi:small subunit ribosomal protein S1
VRAVVLELDKGRRRIRLGMKQLVPTAADEYISSHQSGEVVTGRVTDVSKNRAMVELGDGVQGMCVLAEKIEVKDKSEQKPAPSALPQVDLNALSSLLSSRWKGGGVADSVAPEPGHGAKAQAVRTGQVRSFRITKLDADKKRIDLELA